MVVLNEMSRYHLVPNALRRARRLAPGAAALERHCDAMLVRHHAYIREHLADMPEVRDWTWAEHACSRRRRPSCADTAAIVNKTVPSVSRGGDGAYPLPMRSQQRPRRRISSAKLAALRVAFRYSSSRDAYVLRGIGNRVGPVLKLRDQH